MKEKKFTNINVLNINNAFDANAFNQSKKLTNNNISQEKIFNFAKETKSSKEFNISNSKIFFDYNSNFNFDNEIKDIKEINFMNSNFLSPIKNNLSNTTNGNYNHRRLSYSDKLPQNKFNLESLDVNKVLNMIKETCNMDIDDFLVDDSVMEREYSSFQNNINNLVLKEKKNYEFIYDDNVKERVNKILLDLDKKDNQLCKQDLYNDIDY
jgi:hypothetical protein